MGKIIGEGFKPYVHNQINLRQEKLGQNNRDNDLLTYLTSKNSWIRLTSGVDINQDKATEIGITHQGAALAKYYQLQGGVVQGYSLNRSRNNPRGGVIDEYSGNDTLENTTQAYGFDSTPEFGLVPLPSVESFDITPKNNGSLVVAKVKLKCFNKQQFEKIETLYLRLGFSLLLEWGHSIFFNNDGTLETNPVNIQVSDKFLNPPTSDPLGDTQDRIQGEKEDSSGNYDALLGRVTNFSWTVTPDGHYDATIDVTSTGDVIDSLIISSPIPIKVDDEDNDDDEKDTLKKSVESTPIGRMINAFKKSLVSSPVPRFQVFGRPTKIKRVYSFNGSVITNENIATSAKVGAAGYDDQDGRADKELIYIDVNWTTTKMYYIKFGALLRIIQNFLLLYDNKHGGIPITYIDWKYTDNECVMPVQNLFSADPRILLIPSNYKGKSKWWQGGDVDMEDLNKGLGMDFIGSKEYTCNFMHMHLNLDHILDILESSIDSENNIELIDVLQKLCSDINSTLSNTTQLEPFHDKDDNTLYIVNKRQSQKLLESKNENLPITEFRVGLLPQGEGSFVKDIAIESTIPPNFATQISIGAQATQQATSTSTPFSNWNLGLEDRIITEKKTQAPAETEKDVAARKKSEKEEKEQKAKDYESLIEDVNDAVGYYDNFQFKDNLLNLESSIKEYFKLETNREVQLGENTTSPMVIPLSLSLTMDGISGIKIFQKYTITEDFLPKNYTNALEFIVKGISHNIGKDGWVTKIEGQCIPKSKITSSIPTGGNQTSPGGNQTSSKTNKLNTISQSGFTGDTPNADALRLVLDALGYTEKGKEISNGGDLSLPLTNYAIAVFTEIKSQYPNIKIVVTGGNDKYHQNLSYKSSHSRGDGLDFVITPSDPTTLKNIDLLLQGFAAGNRSPALSFINEYDKPTKAASGKHFHIRIGRDKSGFDKIQDAYALADQGQLVTYTV